MGNRGSGRLLVVTSAAALLAVGSASGIAEVMVPQVINPLVHETVRDRSAQAEVLLETAMDRTAPSESRVDAVRQLSGLFFDYLLANSEELVRDEDGDVAVATVRSLGAQIAMLPDEQHHAGTREEALSEYDEYQQNVVRVSLAALRAALDHPEATVRNEAAAILSSRGDAQGLARIQGLVDEGRMEPREGISYLSLAPTEVASLYIEKYAGSPDPETQAIAIAQLSYNPRYTAFVRDLVLSPEAESRVLAVALPGLAVTDDQFLSYGLALIQNPDVDRAVRSQALESTVIYTLRARIPESAVRMLLPALHEAAGELALSKGFEAVENLRSTYQIQ